MSPLLIKNIADAELQVRTTLPLETGTPSEEEINLVNDLVSKISRIKLGKKTDKRGDRMRWLDCEDQSKLINELNPAESQKAFLSQMVLRLRVKTEQEESPSARVLDLACFKQAELDYPFCHLFGVLAISAEDAIDNIPKLYNMESPGIILPGTPEFEDTQIIVHNFK